MIDGKKIHRIKLGISGKTAVKGTPIFVGHVPVQRIKIWSISTIVSGGNSYYDPGEIYVSSDDNVYFIPSKDQNGLIVDVSIVYEE